MIVEETPLSCWEDFSTWISEIRAKILQPEEDSIVFRGHSSSAWKLESTLERAGQTNMDIRDYLKIAMSFTDELNLLRVVDWQVFGEKELANWTAIHGSNLVSNLPCYAYLVYLRNNGFSSPFVEWSLSPYIAAYFAFQHFVPGESRVAVLAYVHKTGRSYWSIGGSRVTKLPTVKDANHLHFRQKNIYTIAHNDAHNFSSYDLVPNRADQDLLFKCTIPGTERRKALDYLDALGLNAFSLYNSEDAMVRTFSERYF